MRPLGDLTREGPGAYSLHASGDHLRDERALRLATRWTQHALAGEPPERLGGYGFSTEPAGYDALVVRGESRGRGEDGAIAFLYRPS